MRNSVVSAVTAASFVASQLAVPAFAQTTYPYPPPATTKPGWGDASQRYAGSIRCESRGNKRKVCRVRTDNRVAIKRVLGGDCAKGRGWGYTADRIWVSGGCRAEFYYGYAGGTYPTPLPGPVEDYAGTVRCESYGDRYQQCNVQTNGRAELLRRISGKCNAGRQWGYASNYIWVTNGCRAEFGYGYANLAPLPGPKPDKDKGPSTGLIIGGIVVAGGLLALLASKKKKGDDGSAAAPEAPETSYPAGPPAALSADLSGLPSASRPSVQNCMNDAARQIGATGGTRLSYDRLVHLEQGNGGWRIRAAMTATYPDGARSIEMYCRATPNDIVQLDFN